MRKILDLHHGAEMSFHCGSGDPKDNEGCHFTLDITQFGKTTSVYLTYETVEKIIKTLRSGLNESEDEWDEEKAQAEYEEEMDDRIYGDHKYEQAIDESIMGLAEQMKSLCEEIKA